MSCHDVKQNVNFQLRKIALTLAQRPKLQNLFKSLILVFYRVVNKCRCATIYPFRHCFRSKVINNIRSILREVESDEAEQVVVYDLDELVAEDKMMGRLACDNSSLTNDDQDFVNNNEANR